MPCGPKLQRLGSLPSRVTIATDALLTALAPAGGDEHLGPQHVADGREVLGGVRLPEGAADRAAVAHDGVGDHLLGVAEQRQALGDANRRAIAVVNKQRAARWGIDGKLIDFGKNDATVKLAESPVQTAKEVYNCPYELLWHVATYPLWH